MKTIKLALLFLGWCSFAASAHEASKPKGDARKGGPAAKSDDTFCELQLELRDSETGGVIPGMARILDRQGNALPIPELLDRCLGLPGEARKLGWHVMMEPVKIPVPRAKVKIEAVSGLERSVLSRTIDLKEKTEESVTLILNQFWNAAENGLVAGNTHVHLKDLNREEADRYLQEVARADGLGVVFVSYLERALVDRAYITNRHSRNDLKALSSAGLQFGNGEEYRHNFGGGGEGYGHVIFLDLPKLIKPASVGPGITRQGSDGLPLRTGIENARGQGATIVWCHNSFGFEDIPSWTAGLLHAQNIFDGGNRGSYEDSFYRYLNLGMRVPFSTGTDWFIHDYSRVYANLGGSEPTVENWLGALRAGRTFITNGPLLELRVNEKGPGEVIDFDGEVELWCRLTGRTYPGGIELIVNGEVASLTNGTVRTDQDGWFQEVLMTKMQIAEPSWIAARVSPASEATNEFGRKLFAHTSPVYLNVGGEGVFQPETAREMIAEIESNLAEIKTRGEFVDAAGRNSVEAIYRNAIDGLEKRLAKQSH